MTGRIKSLPRRVRIGRPELHLPAPGGKRLRLSPFVLLLVAACDPCFGTTACTDPHISGQGYVIEHLTGGPATGTRVEFRPESGVFVDPDTIWTEVDENGIFTIQMDATGPGEVTGTMVLHPAAPYHHFVFNVGRVRIPTTDIRGEVQLLGVWGVGPLRGPPHISYVGELFYLDTDERAEGIEVEFRRTGGIAVEPDTFVVTSNEQGRFPLFMHPVSGSEGHVIGDLYIRPPAPYQPQVIEGVEMETTVGRGFIRLLGVWGVER